MCNHEAAHDERGSGQAGRPSCDFAAVDRWKENPRPQSAASRRAEFSFVDEQGHSAGEKSDRAQKGEAMREQRGYVFRKGQSWFVRYYDDVLQPDGSIKRVQKCERLAD